jgi:hypothetical protein
VEETKGATTYYSKLNNMYIELYNITNENNMYSHRLFILFGLYFNRAKIQQKAAGRKEKLIHVTREVR